MVTERIPFPFRITQPIPRMFPLASRHIEVICAPIKCINFTNQFTVPGRAIDWLNMCADNDLNEVNFQNEIKTDLYSPICHDAN